MTICKGHVKEEDLKEFTKESNLTKISKSKERSKNRNRIKNISKSQYRVICTSDLKFLPNEEIKSKKPKRRLASKKALRIKFISKHSNEEYTKTESPSKLVLESAKKLLQLDNKCAKKVEPLVSFRPDIWQKFTVEEGKR